MSTQESKISTVKSYWYVWLFPLFGIMICAWLAYDYMEKKGPTIRIMFEEAAGIQAGRTEVRFRGVAIGNVTGLSISEDNQKVIAEVALQKGASHFAVDGSKFWIVVPKVNITGITGLETLVEGTYIAVNPGSAKGDTRVEFKGQVGADSTTSLDSGAPYVLETTRLESVSVGDPITFRGLKIGSVTKTGLNKTAQTVLVNISIERKYVKLVRENTLFWRKTAVKAELGLFKSELKINSFDQMVTGGIELHTPNGQRPIAKAGTVFKLWGNPPEGVDRWAPAL